MPLSGSQQAAKGAVVGGLPRVNLLPPEIKEAERFRRFQFAMAGAGVAAFALVGFLYYGAHHSLQSAKSDYAAAQSQQTRLQSQLAGLQPVRDVYAQVAAKKAMLARAMKPEIRWSYVLTDLSLKIPDNVWLTNITANENVSAVGTPAATATSASSVLPQGYGNVTFTGVAFTHDDVANWLDALANEKGFTNAYFSNAIKGAIGPKTVVNFTSSVTLGSNVLSGRYAAAEG